MERTVYILGAGCSAGPAPVHPGFPLAREFGPALELFARKLSEKPDCVRLKQSVEESVELLRKEGADTLDTLAARLAAEAHDLAKPLSTSERHLRHRQIRSAKIATVALFMELEREAKKTGLGRYHAFLDELFGNENSWPKASRNTPHVVLTFNYDRLLEIAFMCRFKKDARTEALYGKSLLNSGMDYVSDRGISVAHDRFAFLKLHGSVGIRASEEEGGDGPIHYTYYDGLPGDDEKAINDQMFFANAHHPNPYERDPEPLIVFPHEKPFVAAGTRTLLPYRGYVQPIWDEARRLVSRATTIWAIGYRFAPIDRSDVLGLLQHARNCTKLVVQNRADAVDEICDRLRLKWLEPAGLKMKVEPYPHPF